MPHGDLKLSAGYYIIIGIYVLVAVGALAVIIDAMRPKRSHARASLKAAGIKREPLWFYQIFAGLYLLVFVLSQFSSTPHQFKAVAIFAIPVMVAFEVAYLLRVIFPKYVTSDDVAAPTETPLQSSEEISHDEHH